MLTLSIAPKMMVRLRAIADGCKAATYSDSTILVHECDRPLCQENYEVGGEILACSN